jgi:hypothetical protein
MNETEGTETDGASETGESNETDKGSEIEEPSETDDWPESIQVGDIAHARSGDKGNRVNVGVVAEDAAAFERLRVQLTAERVSRYFDGLVEGEVRRYELPNVRALNFVGEDALDGGGQTSLRYDTQGKTYGAALLECELPAGSQEAHDG